MSLLEVAAYVADAAILATYALLARNGRPRPFHWANAVGCLPIIGTEVIAHAWPPMVLTIAFGAIGVAGLIKEYRP